MNHLRWFNFHPSQNITEFIKISSLPAVAGRDEIFSSTYLPGMWMRKNLLPAPLEEDFFAHLRCAPPNRPAGCARQGLGGEKHGCSHAFLPPIPAVHSRQVYWGEHTGGVRKNLLPAELEEDFFSSTYLGGMWMKKFHPFRLQPEGMKFL